mmetsp:Transcript_4145/g.12901  ORF Transcript_4145/g.12901 Transcript_4145/m.12901 type:complete len:104 (+) Transcript_4145:112-423(+)
MEVAIPSPGPRAVGCAKCCVVFATTGVFFLCLIGSLLNSQPLYVKGVEDPAAASKQCFVAAWIYITIVIISVVTLAVDKVHSRRPAYRSPVPEYGAVSYKNRL